MHFLSLNRFCYLNSADQNYNLTYHNFTNQVTYLEVFLKFKIYNVKVEPSEEDQKMDSLNNFSFERILDRLSDLVFIVKVEKGPELRYVYVNEKGLKVLGVNAEHILGKTILEAFKHSPERGSIISEKYQQMVQNHQSIVYSDDFLGADGEKTYTETSLDPLFNDIGELTHIVAIVRDITDLTIKKAELQEKNKSLQEIEHHYQSIIANNNDSVWYTNNDLELVRANEVLHRLLGVSSDIELVELRKKTMEMFETEELNKILYHQRLVLQGNPQEYESFFLRIDGKRIDVQVKVVPVIINGEVQGLYGFAKDISIQKRIKEELRESEERYRSLVELSPGGVLVHQEGKIVYANPTTYKVLHAKEGELIGKSVLELVHPEDREQVMSRIKKTQVKKQVAETVEERFITLDGEIIDGEATAVPTVFNGEPATQVIVNDISERKQKARELKEIRKRLQLFWNHVSDAVFSIGYDGNILDVNPSFTEMLGFSAEELTDLPNPPIFPKEVLDERENLLESLHKGEEITNLRTVRRTKNGQIRTIYASFRPVNHENVLAIGMYKDITHELKIQLALEESEERFRSLFDYNKDAIWSIDLDGKFTSANYAFERIMGISPSILSELDLNDFKDVVITPFEDMITNFEDVKKGKSVEYDLSLFGSSGQIIHLTITNVPIYVDGKIEGIYGIGKDVTEEVNAENTMRESENRFRLIAENMNDLIAVFNLDGIVTYASPSYETVLGIKPEDYVGQLSRSLIHDEDVINIQEKFQKAIQEKSPFTIEYRKKSNQTECLYFETVCMPIFNDKEMLDGFVGVSRNITDRKSAENALSESQERYQLIADHSQDLIQVLDSRSEIIYVSPSFKNVLGFSPEEITENGLFYGVHLADIGASKDCLHEVISTQKSQKIEYRRRHKKGNWVWFEAIVSPIVEKEGKIDRIIVVSRNITDRKNFEEQLQHLAYHDPLTDLPNRRLFETFVDNALLESEREQRITCIMYLDIDKFKQINDTFGHDVGDELLIEFTSRVKGSLRKMDILARMGGDEFTILLPKTEKIYTKIIAERILQAVQEPYLIKGHSIKTSSSIGVAMYPLHGMNAEVLIKRADEALYQVKENGRNGIHIAE